MNESQDKIELALDLLEKFNRKERYHLLCDAVVGSPFTLQDPFLEKINSKLEDHPIPRKGNVYVAMDYHLDWIASVLHLVEKSDRNAARAIRDGYEKIDEYLPPELLNNRVTPEDAEEGDTGDQEAEVITGNQADVDLLVAYQSGNNLILVLIEAKLESGWSGQQLEQKGQRLEKIFSWGNLTDWVIPRVVLAGPDADQSAPNFKPHTLDECPDWFFHPPSSKGKRDNRQLRRVNLTAKHALYQPARKNQHGNEWRVKKTWPKNGGVNI